MMISIDIKEDEIILIIVLPALNRVNDSIKNRIVKCSNTTNTVSLTN